MAINVKAVFDYSATAAVTTAWSLTASTSVAVGDVLVLSMAWRTTASASHTISAISDNAGNAWTRIVENASTGFNTGMFYAVVTTTTANYQVALAPAGDKTVSARAAHIMVLSGVDTANPLDAGAVATGALLASPATTATLSTSTSTSVNDELLVLSAHQNNISSATIVADVAWTLRGNVVAAAGGAQNVKKFLWSRAAAVPAIYQWSASLSNGGATRTRIFQLAAFKPASTGSVTGSAAMTFSPSAKLVASASASGSIALGFVPDVTLVGAVAGSASASFAFATQANLTGIAKGAAAATLGVAVDGALRGPASGAGTAGLAFGSNAQLGTGGAIAGNVPLSFQPIATPTGGVADDASPAISTLLGGGWDRHLYHKLRERRRRDLERQASELTVPRSDSGEALLPCDWIGAVDRGSAALPNLMVQLGGQATSLEAIGRRLQILDSAIERRQWEREAEEMLLLAA